MPDLQRYNARVCFTVVAWLVHEQKVLLVHHKKLDMWLSPGGHVEDKELPHTAAEREFWEETGVKVKAVDSTIFPKLSTSEDVPNPIYSNLHWVCKENYDVRHGRLPADKVPEGWRKKKCEQHVALAYLVEPVGSLKFTQNVEETLGIGWFGEKDLDELQTTDDIKQEIRYVLKLERMK